MKRAVLPLVLILTASGCANPDGSTNTVGQGTLEGGGAGAALGAIGCALAKCNSGQYAAAMAIGGGIGAAVGYSLSKDIEKRRSALAGKENNLDARLIYVRGLNADTDKFNRQLRDNVQAAQQQINQGNLSGQALEKQRKQLNDQISGSNTQLQALDKELADMKRYRGQASTPSSPALDGEIGRLEALLADARSNTTALASLRQRI